MRELKFRAWNGKRMWCIEELDFRYQKALEKHALGVVDWVDLEIMQFTGLLDKNGTEVYDGDVFSHVCAECETIGHENCPESDHTCAVVFWSDQLQAFMWHPVNEDEGMSTLLPDSDELEVIGNVYENQGLLKGH